MFSSVRHIEHVRNAINMGVHTITAPWGVLTQLTENNFTTVGTNQFFEHTRLMTHTVGESMSSVNPLVEVGAALQDAIVKMTECGFGCVTVVNDDGSLRGVFTDGDLRRLIQAEGRAVLEHTMGDLDYGTPVQVAPSALLNEANTLFHTHKVDTLLVVDGDRPLGMLDIQDL